MNDQPSRPDAEQSPPQVVTFDAIMPAAMAVRAEESGVKRASMDPLTILVLSVLGGAFVAFGAIFATTVSAGSIAVTSADGAAALSAALPYGITRLLIGLVFSVGLILVIVGGAELFTGNTLIVMAWASGKVGTRAVLLNWIIAFTGNFVGAIGTAALMFLTTQYTFGGGAVGLVALSTANSKAALDICACADARHHVQRAGLPGGVDVLRRAHHNRPGGHDRPADNGVCRGRLRALRRQYVFHSDRSFHQGRRAGLVLGIDRQDSGGLSGLDLGQFPDRKSRSR